MKSITVHRSPRRLAFRLGLLMLAMGLVAGCFQLTRSVNMNYNPSKPHHTPEGFKNNYPHAAPESFWAWQWERIRLGVPPKAPEGGWPIARVANPDVAYLQSNRSERSLTWLGHAAMLLQAGGQNVLIDPVFSERTSPVQFVGPKREVPLAIRPDQLPRTDLVFISHNHYDHLDLASVKGLNAQAGGPPLFVVPLGLKAWFVDQGISHVRELDWWDSFEHNGLKLTFVPAQHWSKRSLIDTNRSLWGGIVIEDRGWSFFYTGDTGYSQDFKDIGARFGGFDMAAIPIGAYAPRWFMQAQHVNPDDAVKIFEDVKAKQAIGVHWGTFVLTDEPLDEPPKLLAIALRERGIDAKRFRTWAHGEMRRF